MKNITGRSTWIVFKIWSIAILLNSLIGTLVLTGAQGADFSIPLIGAYYGAIFSSPIFIVFLVLLNFLVRKEASFKTVFITLMATGLILTVIVLTLFFAMVGLRLWQFALYAAACCSAVIAIGTQVNALRRITSYSNLVDELLENETSGTATL